MDMLDKNDTKSDMTEVILEFKRRKIHGKFILKSKYTFIRGDSATGKTFLCNLFRQRDTQFKLSDGYKLIPLPVELIFDESPELILRTLSVIVNGYDRVVFYCDEDIRYVVTKNFQIAMSKSPYLYLIINRDKLDSLSYSVRDIYKLCYAKEINDVHSYWLEQLYTINNELSNLSVTKLYTEDSKSLLTVCKKLFPSAMSCDGKNNVADKLLNESNTLCVVDTLGFGSCIAKCNDILQIKTDNSLVFIESFEYQVLRSRMFQGYISSFAWERIKHLSTFRSNREEYFTSVLAKLLKKLLGIDYDKGDLPLCFLRDCCPTDRNNCKLRIKGNKPEVILEGVVLQCINLV